MYGREKIVAIDNEMKIEAEDIMLKKKVKICGYMQPENVSPGTYFLDRLVTMGNASISIGMYPALLPDKKGLAAEFETLRQEIIEDHDGSSLTPKLLREAYEEDIISGYLHYLAQSHASLGKDDKVGRAQHRMVNKTIETMRIGKRLTAANDPRIIHS